MSMSDEEMAWREAASADLREDDHVYTLEAPTTIEDSIERTLEGKRRMLAHFDPEDYDPC